jgi:tripartite-type tricarboxylate transporter receptor subunit TctC
MKTPRFSRILAALALLACANLSFAQGWPTKTITLVVPWPPGGPSDLSARPLAKGLSEILGKTVIVENRAGAGGNIGADLVAKSVPDGHTLLLSSSGPTAINQFIYKKMPYDTQHDFAPVTNVVRVPLVLVVHPSVPAKNLQELIAYIKAQNGKFQWASAGNGTAQHLTGEMFRTNQKLDMVHVPYKGSAPAITDIVGGHIPAMFDTAIAIVPQIKAGKVRAIAVTGSKRSPHLPDVPTFTELGVPAVVAYSWYGLFAPAKTPRDVVDKLHAATVKVMKGPDFQKVLADVGSEYVGDTPENFGAFVRGEWDKWSKIAKETGATVD